MSGQRRAADSQTVLPRGHMAEMHRQRSAAEYYLFARNHALCLVRHCPGGLLPSALLLYFLKWCYQSLLLLATGRLKEVSAVWVGLLDFGMRRFGEGRLARFSSKGV